MKTRIYLLTLLFVLCSLNNAVSQDSMDSLIQRFFTGKQQLQNNYHTYVDSINVQFADYLANNWELFSINSPITRSGEPEPAYMPVYEPYDTIATTMADTLLIEWAPRKNDMQSAASKESSGAPMIDFFGTPVTVTPFDGYETKLQGTNEKQVANYWMQLSKTNYPSFIHDISTKKEALGIGSWGLYRLVLEWANTSFHKSQEDEKAVFIVYMLNQAGYKAKIGRLNNTLVVMMAFTNTIYGKPFIRSGNDSYYILSDQTITGASLSSYKLDYGPATSFFDLHTKTLPRLNENTHTVIRLFRDKTYTFKFNSNLTHYYHTFPQTELKIYVDTPFSAIAEDSIVRELAYDLQNKSVPDKLKFLLALIQEGFEYKTDEEQFGYEKSFFAEETLLYPYSDCEDRAILFCKMVKLLCGLDTLLIDYPTHVASAVKSDEPGDAIMYHNERYIVCDPSFIGAPIAKTMKGQDNTKAKIIEVQ